MLAGVPMSCWSCLWDVRSTSGSGGTGAGAGFMSPHGSPLSPRSCWDRGRTMSRCFLAGPLGAPMPWFSLFPALLLCGTLQWGPKGVLLSNGCLEHVPLCLPGASPGQGQAVLYKWLQFGCGMHCGEPLRQWEAAGVTQARGPRVSRLLCLQVPRAQSLRVPSHPRLQCHRLPLCAGQLQHGHLHGPRHIPTR